MEYYGESKKITRILNDERKLIKAFGKKRTEIIVQRLNEFRAAENLSQIS